MIFFRQWKTMRQAQSLTTFSARVGVKSDLNRFTEHYDGNNLCNALQSSFPDTRLKSPVFKRGKPVVMSFWSMALVWIVFPVTHVCTMRYLFFPSATGTRKVTIYQHAAPLQSSSTFCQAWLFHYACQEEKETGRDRARMVLARVWIPA